MEILFRVRVRGKRKETSEAAMASKIVYKLIIRIKYNQFTEQQSVEYANEFRLLNLSYGILLSSNILSRT